MHSSPQNYPSVPPQGGPGYAGHESTSRKPLILGIAISWSMAIAALYLFSAILALISGKGTLLRYIATESLGEVSDSQLEQLASDPEVTAALEEGYGAIATKATFLLVAGMAILVFTWLSRNGAAWARALVLVTTFVAMVPASILLGENSALAINKILPTGTWLAAFCAVPLSLAVYVLFFLPPINRYARAQKLRRQ
ncbi:hypothetical protein ACFLIM_49855 [Nonomuraea sp. M3C6]|uniref:Uncharacterized protein n=1 Tax=Nonomuraea marmarensis TaxID=3351344 RepID=A0ABW7AW48_9ACTN